MKVRFGSIAEVRRTKLNGRFVSLNGLSRTIEIKDDAVNAVYHLMDGGSSHKVPRIEWRIAFPEGASNQPRTLQLNMIVIQKTN